MTQGGKRFNQEKPKLGLISALAKAGMARVLMFGMQKYDAWNWQKGLDISETLESLERHIDCIRAGELIDEESGLPHVDHMQCNTMFLSHFFHSGQWDELAKTLPPRYGLEDRPPLDNN